VTDISYFHEGDNASLIEKVAALGYLRASDSVLDCTFGEGSWWKKWYPEDLRAYDQKIQPWWDFTKMEFRDLWEDEVLEPGVMPVFDVVCFDPPYRLRGKPDPTFDTRYGTDERATEKQVMQLIHDGLRECVKVTKHEGYILCKIMDQVVSGRVVWQTWWAMQWAQTFGCQTVDRFDMPPARPQPSGRRQVHARRGSTLLIFSKS
jgi:hypothetical protein